MKKMIKKSTSLLLILAMIATMLITFNTGISAATKDEEMAAKGYTCRLGDSMTEDTYFTSPGNAYAKAQDGDTIYFIVDNAYYGTWQLNNANIKKLTVDGQGHSIVQKNSGNNTANRQWLINLNYTEQLTVKNCEFTCFRGFYTAINENNTTQVSNKSNKLILENCVVNGMDISGDGFNKDDPLEFMFFGKNANTDLVIKNSTINNSMGITPFYYQNETAPVNIDIINSTIISNGEQHINADSYKNAVFASRDNVMNITIDSTSKIIQQSKGKANATKSEAPIFSTHKKEYINVTLETGATLELGTSNLNVTEWSRDNLVTITDKGANWVMSADIAKAGVTMPTITTPSDMTYIGVGEQTGDSYKVIAKPTTYQNTEATDKVTLTTLALTTDALTNRAGASIRTEDPYGIRFTADMTDMLYNVITNYATDASFGMLVAPTAKVETNGFDLDTLAEGTDYVEVVCESYDNQSKEGERFYRLVTYDIDESKAGFTYQYSVTAFVKFTIGETEYAIYADYSVQDNSRSLYDVAKAAKEAGITGTAIDNILAIVDGEAA